MWPLALVDVVNEPVNASQWERIHARQATVLGIAGTLAYLILLALPLLVVIAVPGLSPAWIVVLYGVGLAADLAAAVWLFAVVLRYAGRASRGELFAIPVVSPLVDRLFRARTPSERGGTR